MQFLNTSISRFTDIQYTEKHVAFTVKGICIIYSLFLAFMVNPAVPSNFPLAISQRPVTELSGFLDEFSGSWSEHGTKLGYLHQYTVSSSFPYARAI